VKDLTDNSKGSADRRSFMRKGLAVAGLGAGLLANRLPAFGQQKQQQVQIGGTPLSNGDAAILRFLAAAELIEADLWQQYAELGGLTPGQLPVETAPFTPMNSYQAAFMNLDPDGPQYISSNTSDEQSHASFLNAYLVAKGREPVDLDAFRTLPSSQATGAQQIGRLTNLMQLSVDTSWYTRYRSTTNPDFGATFPQALPQLSDGVFTAIPRTNADFAPANHIQAIANTAAFHFGFIEQGGSSLYATLSQLVSSAEVLKITLSIGGDEIAHFLEWVDFSGNGVQPPIAPFTDPTNGLTFPNFDVIESGGTTVNPLLQTNLIFPVPCEFISPNLPMCAVIRPTSQGQINAMGAAQAFIADGLFIGQPPTFTEMLLNLAKEADAAQRMA
jgi:Ferritin-like domain